MKKINLRELYPGAYTTDFFVNVTEDVLETIRASERAEAAYERKMYRYKAQYSLDFTNANAFGLYALTKVAHNKHLSFQFFVHCNAKFFFKNFLFLWDCSGRME